MKRQWTTDELMEHWTLAGADGDLLANKTGATRLGFAPLLKCFQYLGRFPQDQADVPIAAIAHVARQLDLSPELYAQYDWSGRVIAYHRAQIRQTLEFRESTEQDIDDLTAWLGQAVLPREHRFEQVEEAVYVRYRGSHIEPPSSGRINRLIRSALHTYEDELYRRVLARIGEDGLVRIDALLALAETAGASAESSDPQRLTLQDLKADPGRISLDSVRIQTHTLRHVQQLALPPDLFAGVSPKVTRGYRERAAAEPPSELRAHPDPVRATLVAALCLLRSQEIADGLIDLVIAMVHKIGATAERSVEKELLDELKRVTGKMNLLFHIAEASVEHPDGVIRDIIFPVAGGEMTLRDLVREYKSTGPAYRLHVQTHLRASYRAHYRRVLPDLLEVLEFRSNNAAHQPVIRALALLKRYAASKSRLFAAAEDVPIDGVVPPGWLDTVVRTDGQGRERIDRINYEIAVLQTLRDKLRCKHPRGTRWVVGADRFRNPDEDLPADFDRQRAAYYEALRLPTDADTFLKDLQAEMTAALTALNRDMPKNPGVQLLAKNNGWIKISPLDPLPEPQNLGRLKGEIGRLWPMTSLLDMLKEADLRIDFNPRLHQRRLSGGARPRGAAPAPPPVPLRPGHEHQAQAHRRQRARRELE